MIRSAWSDEWDDAVASIPAGARAAEARAKFEERMEAIAPALAIATKIGISYRELAVNLASAFKALERKDAPPG